jgi:DNA-binding MarR family transcriptional regulator
LRRDGIHQISIFPAKIRIIVKTHSHIKQMTRFIYLINGFVSSVFIETNKHTQTMTDIREVIKQKNFINPLMKAQVNLIYTYNHYTQETGKIFRQHNLLPQHFNVLKIVKGKHPEPATPSYILEVMLDKGRDLTRLVDKLVEMGYLKRSQCKVNKRKRNISITEKGMHITDEIEKTLQIWTFANIKLTEQEAETLSKLLDKLRG